MAARYWVTGGNGNTSSTTNWSDTSGGASGFSVPVSTDDAIWDANSGSGTVTVNGTLNVLSVNFTGFTGTLTGSSTMIVNGNVTFSNTMTSTWTGPLSLTTTATLTSGGQPFNAVIFGGISQTYTLADDWDINGNITSGGSGTITINGNNIYFALQISIATTTVGTTNFIADGTSAYTGASTFRNNLTVNTTSTFSIIGAVTYNTGTFTNIACSEFITAGSGIVIGLSTTLDLRGAVLNNLTTQSSGTITLLSDFGGTGNWVCNTGSTVIYSGAYTINWTGTWNCNNNGILSFVNTTVNLYGNLTWLGGTTGIELVGLTLNLNADFVLTSRIRIGAGTTVTYNNKSKAKANTAILAITGACTLINLNKIVFQSIVITAGVTVTMNQFFNGSANVKTPISSTTTTNYIIAFQDGFEKIAKFVKVSNCTISNRNQLLILTDKGNANTAGSSNLGIRYTNQVPNGISKNNPSVVPQVCFGIDDGFCADPLTR